ncbi:WhiB family transcriptional regulator [Streptomyces sp. LBUM 1479]|uniref:WhiB family transcriptional regulator n=1 Tax=Streptomyces scabiei TaxID=1930 RepID=UPI001B30C9EF|nr:WhiB family transcriptional regulator [Streptomyces sp. LBUM 1475]MBP5930156.1 WhiB family transcriptional regulator [Streptomyces sp. LBUM 1479]QTU63159.1 WhiB family transcriptional regulator [Streptomyces sp. LBUM 1475]
METSREWELQAVCRTEDPNIWFSKTTWTRAKKICLEVCPVREECLEAILARESLTADTLRFGIVAGLTGAQRAKLHAGDRAPKPKAKPPGPGRPHAPCGTRSAYERHRRKGEPIDQACRDAQALSNREYRRTGSTKVAASH